MDLVSFCEIWFFNLNEIYLVIEGEYFNESEKQYNIIGNTHYIYLIINCIYLII